MANNDDIEVFVQFMTYWRKLSNSKSAESAENITNELVRLRERHQENCTIINRFTEDNVKLSKRTGAADEEMKRLQGEVERLQVELTRNKKDLADAKRKAKDCDQRLGEEAEKVKQLEQYRVNLVVESGDDVSERWIELWKMINQLATDYFSDDLDPDTLQGARGWKPSTSEEGSTNFPSPATNSKEAKQMRIIAVDTAIALALMEHIFWPVGIEREFSEALSDLACLSPDMESFHRSSYLAVIDKMEDYQNETVDRAVKAARKEILSSISQILPEAKTKDFGNRLEHVCKVAAREWRIFQQYKERYEVDTAAGENSYRPVPLWQPAAEASSPRTNGAARHPTSDDTRSNQSAERPSPSRRKSKSSAVVTCVWPMLKVANTSSSVPNIPGLALVSYQTSEAEEQVRREKRRTSRGESKEDENTNISRPMAKIGKFLPGSTNSS
ncbi:uncharacterized protein DNG_02239 [Cephalotrichum gorgonifer]|uniref:Uncharacterized protein n=1 Tax=Cephalotrichum gorgonifer TaxID=2041049 RepID=A0AAE8MS30_9PEZI|nr:uncharacterized protein DNG_02239 [Cephalotrichum gorgonifer]